MRKNSFILVFLLLVSTNMYAGNTFTAGNSFLTIHEITPFSIVNPQNTDWEGYTQITFTTAITWLGSTGCNTTSVAVRSEDTHILSLVYQAYAMGEAVRLYSDTTLTIGISDYCILRGLSIQ